MGNEDVLEGIPFIGMIPATIRPLVIELLDPRSYEFGDVIIQQGGPPDGLYLMVNGSARVVMAADGGIEATLGHVGPGDTFGEAALLDGAPRSATVRASSHVEVLTLDARVFEALRRLHPEPRYRPRESSPRPHAATLSSDAVGLRVHTPRGFDRDGTRAHRGPIRPGRTGHRGGRPGRLPVHREGRPPEGLEVRR